VIAERAGQGVQLLARPRAALTQAPAPSTASSGLDERVVMLVIGLAIIRIRVTDRRGSRTRDYRIGAARARRDTSRAHARAPDLSVQVYGRGNVSVAAIGIIASPFFFDTGTAMAIAVFAAVAQ
jgi:hypothetical protein